MRQTETGKIFYFFFKLLLLFGYNPEKQPNVVTNKWLNKYDKWTDDKSSWLSLPEAGKMCKVSEKGVVAVLQIGRQTECIAIVKTSDILNKI